MKTIFKTTVILFMMLGINFNSYAVISGPSPETETTIKKKKESIFTQLEVNEILTMSRTDIEAKVGRKLKLRERMGLKIVHNAVKKMNKKINKKRKESSAKENLFGIIGTAAGGLGLSTFFTGYGGFTLGVAGIVFGIISLKREEPKKIFGILGIVLGGLAVLLSIIWLLIFIASFF